MARPSPPPAGSGRQQGAGQPAARLPGRHPGQGWERIRAGGRTRYILTRGVLGRGVPMAILVAVGIELHLGGSFPEALRTPAFLGRLLLALVVFSTSGCLTARLTWDAYERHRARST